MDPRPHEFTTLLKRQGADTIKITFYSAKHWPDQGGKEGLWRLKVGRPKKEKPGEFSERWWPAPRDYQFLTKARAWELVAEMASFGDITPAPRPDIPKATPVRVPNGKIVAGDMQYDATRTSCTPIRLEDGRDYVQVLLYGQGTIFVPVDEITIMRR